MKKLICLIGLVSLLAIVAPVSAEIGTIDNVPAGTLLLPYFEVDIAGEGDTLFSVNNASAAPALAHVTFWTDWSIPVLDFDIYLSGYDVQTLSVRNVIVNGQIPATGNIPVKYPNQQDLAGNPSVFATPACLNTGGLTTQVDIDYGTVPQSILDGVQAALTGQQVQGQCLSSDQGDGVARGYITIDAVRQCSLDFPSSPGYFDAATGVADLNPATANVLWGDVFLLDTANDFAQGFTLVHLEVGDALSVDCTDPTSGGSFYCRYSSADLTQDRREALGSTYGIRWIGENDFFTGGTDLLVFRAPSTLLNPTCASPLVLLNEDLTVFDEQENPATVTLPDCPSSPFGGSECSPTEVPFPYETNRVSVGNDFFVGTFQFGWLLVDLNGATTGSTDQGYVQAVMSADGKFSIGIDAEQLDNLTQP
jgi:hypothetical protein